MMDVEYDKLTETYSLKIPEILKVRLSSLSVEEKKRLNAKIMVEIARIIHESQFNPCEYLTTQ